MFAQVRQILPLFDRSFGHKLKSQKLDFPTTKTMFQIVVCLCYMQQRFTKLKPEVSKYNRSILRIFPYGAEVSFTDFPLVTVRVGGDRRVIIASMFTLANASMKQRRFRFYLYKRQRCHFTIKIYSQTRSSVPPKNLLMNLSFKS